VPSDLLHHGLLIGTPAQIADRLRHFADVGLYPVVLGPISAFVYTPAALYRIAHLLTT
jgi:alkanesulfonate monooxygenase SsuD/methylene tetrahydromethanopterin reductase-like flavin-dependent oxidoreductase (luciferase family)